MNINEVRVGDRFYVCDHRPVDEHGQNATVRFIDQSFKTVQCNNGMWWTPGINCFWTNPTPPPKPKKKARKSVWVAVYRNSVGDVLTSPQYGSLKALQSIILPRRILDVHEFTWEDEE